jgi:hypothetical protein
MENDEKKPEKSSNCYLQLNGNKPKLPVRVEITYANKDEENLLKDLEHERSKNAKIFRSARKSITNKKETSGFIITVKSPENSKPNKNDVFYIKDDPLVKRRSRSISKAKSEKLSRKDDSTEKDTVNNLYKKARDDKEKGVDYLINGLLGVLKKEK